MSFLPRRKEPTRRALDLSVIAAGPASESDQPDAETQEELDDLDHKAAEARLAGIVQDTAERKKYAGRIFWLIVGWLSGVFALLVTQGVLSPLALFNLSENVLLAVVGGTTINVIGIFLVVARYLFPKK